MPTAKILVVDDDPDFVEIMRTVLQSAGYTIVSAGNSAEALVQIKAERPDLMLLDIMMNTVTEGLSLSEQLRDDPALRYLPIIMVSSIAETPYAGVVQMEDAYHMEAWISKPVEPKYLLETVQRVLEGAG